MTPTVAPRVWSGQGWEVREGRWQDSMADVKCAAVITDPPYTRRTLIGYRNGNDYAVGKKGTKRKMNIPYDAWTREQCREYCEWAVRSAAFWIVTFNDHIGQAWIADDLTDLGWYVFAPVIWIAKNGAPRMTGDGPSCRAEYITVARPKIRLPRERVGHRDGYYIHGIANAKTKSVVGEKPLDLMRAIMRDYTLRGDVVADPFLGGGTTVLAAALEGRTGIGAEEDPARCKTASERIAAHAGQMSIVEARP